MTKTICIYHANCADGFTAAWAVRMALDTSVECIPARYGDTPPDVAGADVVLVDFSYKRPELKELAAAANSVLILDHHKSAQMELSIFPTPAETWDDHLAVCSCHDDVAYAIFDMKRSGAQIAWDFFHPRMPRPAIVDYVGDRDLWKFELTSSREISAWLFSHEYDFGDWNSYANRLDDARLFQHAAYEGAAILRKHHKDIAEHLGDAQRQMKIGGHLVPVANVPKFMASDTGHLMAKGKPFAATYFDRDEGREFSLRSSEDGMDVSEIAAQYGGGGHAGAAGFLMSAGWEGDQ